MLGHGLGAVLGGRADESVLDQYERTRRRVAERVVAFTDRMTRMATLRSTRARALRNAAIRIISQIPGAPRWLATELAGLHNPSTLLRGWPSTRDIANTHPPKQSGRGCKDVVMTKDNNSARL
jgi:hypothetical protein